MQTHMSALVSLKINTAGLINSEMQNKLNPQVPIIEEIFKISQLLEKLQAIKFYGNPVKIEPLTYSVKPKIRENRKKDEITFLVLKIKNKKEISP